MNQKITVMETNTILNADYLDILFDGRNHKYGSYVLRRYYANRLGKSMMYMGLGIAALVLMTLQRPSPAATVPTLPQQRVCTLSVIPPFNPPPVPPPPRPQALKPAAAKPAGPRFTQPVITREQVQDDKLMASAASLVVTTPGLGDADSVSTGIVGGGSDESATTSAAPSITPNVPLHAPDIMPAFDGDLQAYLARNIRYPEAARDAGIEGRVIIEFVVNEHGVVSHPRIVRRIGGGCDEEALRVVAAMPPWKPGKNKGVPVSVFFAVPIAFRLQ